MVRCERVQNEFTDQADQLLPPEFRPKFGVVLGSGLGQVIDDFELVGKVGYAEINGLPVSGVPGHAGSLCFVRIEGVDAVIAAGRVHLYEGWSAKEVTAMVRLFAMLGVRSVLLTNAAGTLRRNQAPGGWMALTDHLNLQTTSPLEGGPNFVDMTNVYDEATNRLLKKAASENSLALQEGVYAAVRGPQYETPAEVRMLGGLGADAVGMSTVLEAIQARALGLKVVGLSRLTNWAAGLGESEISHGEVIEGQSDAAKELGVFLRALAQDF
ncbi:MAG: purine-nucleoside phosphorylase [Verrucomicrobiota bacterium]